MYADPVTIEKDGEEFDVFFIDSEGLLPRTATSDRISGKFNDSSYTSDIIGER